MSQRQHHWHPAEQYKSQIVDRDHAQFNKLRNVFGVTYRNLDADSEHQSLRPFGTTLLIILSYHLQAAFRTMPLRAFRPVLRDDASVEYVPTALHSDGLQCYDAVLAPIDGEPDPVTPALPTRRRQFLDWVTRFDADIAYGAKDDVRLPIAPMFPHTYLAFSPDALPDYAMTPGLARFAAKELRRGTEFSEDVIRRKLEHPDAIGQRALEGYFQRQLIQPGQKAGRGTLEPEMVNTTPYVLLHIDFCSNLDKAVAAFESFANLCGRECYNPARQIMKRAAQRAGYDPVTQSFQEAQRLKVPNPTREVFQTLGLPVPTSRHHSFDYLTAEQDEELLFSMTAAIVNRGGLAAGFTRDDLYAAILHPDQPALAISEIARRLRRQVPQHLRDLATADDYRAAVLNPHKKLQISQAYRVQVCRAQKVDPADAFVLEHLLPQCKLAGNLWVQPGTCEPADRRVVDQVEESELLEATLAPTESGDVEELATLGTDDVFSAGVAQDL